MTKVKLTKKVGNHAKDTVLTVDDASAQRMVEANQAKVLRRDVEEPAQDA